MEGPAGGDEGDGTEGSGEELRGVPPPLLPARKSAGFMGLMGQLSLCPIVTFCAKGIIILIRRQQGGGLLQQHTQKKHQTVLNWNHNDTEAFFHPSPGRSHYSRDRTNDHPPRHRPSRSRSQFPPRSALVLLSWNGTRIRLRTRTDKSSINLSILSTPRRIRSTLRDCPS